MPYAIYYYYAICAMLPMSFLLYSAFRATPRRFITLAVFSHAIPYRLRHVTKGRYREDNTFSFFSLMLPPLLATIYFAAAFTLMITLLLPLLFRC